MSVAPGPALTPRKGLEGPTWGHCEAAGSQGPGKGCVVGGGCAALGRPPPSLGLELASPGPSPRTPVIAGTLRLQESLLE